MPSWTQRPDLEPTKTPTDIDVAWSAGVYEGEGTIHEQRHSSATIQVVQKDPEILYRLRDWFGGKVRPLHAKTVPEDKQCQVWYTCGDKARIMAARIYPFLSARRKSQIDATHTLEFLCGESPEGMSLQRIKEKLNSFTVTRLGKSVSAIQRRNKKTRENSSYLPLHDTSGDDTPERVM